MGKKFKRGDRVRVVFEGIVAASSSKEEDGSPSDEEIVRVSVKHPKLKETWYAIVPGSAVKKEKE